MKYFNNKMLKSLLPLLGKIESVPTATLEDIIDKGFKVDSDRIFLSGLFENCDSVNADSFPDSTGYECFINRLNIDDYFDENWLLISIWYSELLSQKLKNKYPKSLFRFIISLDEFTCAVRFHQKRDGEEWLQKDLEKYTEESLLIIDY